MNSGHDLVMTETEMPQCVTSQRGSRPMDCYRLQDGRFHVVCKGEAAVMLTGGDHILVREPLTSILGDLCSHCLDLVPAVVVQIVSGETWPGYSEVLPHEQITPDAILTTDLSGYKVWGFRQQSIFVSPAVMREISRRGIDGLEFSPGFSRFPGAA